MSVLSSQLKPLWTDENEEVVVASQVYRKSVSARFSLGI